MFVLIINPRWLPQQETFILIIDCCLTSSEQYFSYIHYIRKRWFFFPSTNAYIKMKSL